EIGRQLVDLVVGLGCQRLALVLGQRAGQLVAPGADAGGHRVELGRPLERAGTGPARPGTGGRAHRARDVGRVSLGDGGELLAGRRAGGDGGTAAALAPGTPDVEQVLSHAGSLSALLPGPGKDAAPAAPRPASRRRAQPPDLV